VFPNPSNGDNVYLKMNGLAPNEEILVVLNDVLGQQVFSKVMFADTNGTVLEAINGTQNLPAGVYLIVGSRRNIAYKQKLIIK